MKRMMIKLIRRFRSPSAARVRAELRRDAKRMILGSWFGQGLHGRTR